MVHIPDSNEYRGATKAPRSPALALRTQPMATTLVSVETREVVRCEHAGSCNTERRTHSAENATGPSISGARYFGTATGDQPARASFSRGWFAGGRAGARDSPRAPSQPAAVGWAHAGSRTYISKIENGKAIPTLGSLERLARALEVDVCQLVRDTRSRREEEVAAIFADPFLAEIAALLPQLESLHRTLFYGAVRDASTGRRRSA